MICRVAKSNGFQKTNIPRTTIVNAHLGSKPLVIAIKAPTINIAPRILPSMKKDSKIMTRTKIPIPNDTIGNMKGKASSCKAPLLLAFLFSIFVTSKDHIS